MLEYLIVFAAGFVVGILFGRKNTKKVEKALNAAKSEIEPLEEKAKADWLKHVGK